MPRRFAGALAGPFAVPGNECTDAQTAPLRRGSVFRNPSVKAVRTSARDAPPTSHKLLRRQVGMGLEPLEDALEEWCSGFTK